MAQTNNNAQAPGITNPLQTNNSVTVLLGYLAGIAAAKLPIFDFATWNYIFMSSGGILFVMYTAYTNRKTKVVSTVANMPEVKNEGGVVLDKTVPGAAALAKATPDNVVLK